MTVYRDQRGFTLTELLVASALMGVVLLATSALYVNTNTLFITETNRAEAQQGGRVALMIQEDLRMIGTGVPAVQPKITAATPTTITFVGDTRGASTLLTAAVAPGNTTFNVSTTAGIQVGDAVNLINGATWQNFTVTGTTATTISVGVGSTGSYPVGAQVGVPRTITYQWIAGTQTLMRDAGDGNGLLPLAAGVQNFALTYFDGNSPEAPTTVLAAIRRIAISMTTQSSATAGAGYFTINSDARPRNL